MESNPSTRNRRNVSFSEFYQGRQRVGRSQFSVDFGNPFHEFNKKQERSRNFFNSPTPKSKTNEENKLPD